MTEFLKAPAARKRVILIICHLFILTAPGLYFIMKLFAILDRESNLNK